MLDTQTPFSPPSHETFPPRRDASQHAHRRMPSILAASWRALTSTGCPEFYKEAKGPLGCSDRQDPYHINRGSLIEFLSGAVTMSWLPLKQDQKSRSSLMTRTNLSRLSFHFLAFPNHSLIPSPQINPLAETFVAVWCLQNLVQNPLHSTSSTIWPLSLWFSFPLPHCTHPVIR